MNVSSLQRPIVVERTVAAPADAVFDAVTDPEALVTWWGSRDRYRCTSWEMDLRPEGAWRSEGENVSGQRFVVHGELREVERPRRLSFTWNASWEDLGTTLVSIELEPTERGTFVRWVHDGIDRRAEERPGYESGTGAVVGWLADFVERGITVDDR
jgi:uncharacterized protein YndB with AHSA1/START domain